MNGNREIFSLFVNDPPNKLKIDRSIFYAYFQVPKEKCSTFERDPKPPVCRTANRLECKNTPQEECRQVIDTQCQQVPRQKCQTPKKSKCQQICEPVYWCKVCQL